MSVDNAVIAAAARIRFMMRIDVITGET